MKRNFCRTALLARATALASALAAMCSFDAAADDCADPQNASLWVCFDTPTHTVNSRCEQQRRLTVGFLVRGFPKPQYTYRFSAVPQGAAPEWRDAQLPAEDLAEAYPFHEARPSFDLEVQDFMRKGPFVLSIEVRDSRGNINHIETRLDVSAEVDAPPRVHALIVGVSKYRNAPSPPELAHAADDATAFSRLLAEIYPNEFLTTGLLVDQDATRENIERKLQMLINSTDVCGPDTFIFYFSGHGLVQARGRRPVQLLASYDADLKNLSTTTIGLLRLLADVEWIEAARKVVIIDSCFSGASGGGTKMMLVNRSGQSITASSTQFSDTTDLNGRIRDHLRSARLGGLYLSASAKDEPAIEVCVQSKTSEDELNIRFIENGKPCATDGVSGETGHGLYTYMLLDAVESQMAKKHGHGDISGDGYDRAQPNDCLLDFKAAHEIADGMLKLWHTKLRPRKLQDPDIVSTTNDWAFECRMNGRRISQMPP